MRKTFLLIFLALIIFSNAYSQYTNVTIFIPTLSEPPMEPSICINPKNINLLVAGANINYVTYSTNGGVNWVGQSAIFNIQYGVCGDPCIICDTSGTFYYFHLSNSVSPGYWIDRIVCQKSTNNGATWNNPGTFTYFNSPKEQDKEWACVDPRNNFIYVTWTQFDNYGGSNQLDSSNILFSKSTDGGDSWVNFGNETAKRINKLGGDCGDRDNTVEGAVPCVGPNGEVYVVWAGPKIRNAQFGIFFNKSTDEGNNWLSEPVYVADQPGGWDYIITGLQRSNGLPITCCDISNSNYRGNVYINWTDSAGPGDHDVKFVKSTNGGLNWSSPLRVNNDAAGKEQFMSWMTVDQKNGHIYIVFYDRRNYTTTATDVYIARSTDGGNTFNNFIVSSSSFTSSGAFIGDYNNITAYDGRVRPIWTRLAGSYSVLTAIVDFTVGVNSNSEIIPAEFKLGQNYPNPFNPSTTINYSIKENTFISLKIYNLIGQEIATLVNMDKSAGNYSINFDAKEYSLTSGVYFYKLTAGNFTDTKKMIITK
jgi:hypothetical protein